MQITLQVRSLVILSLFPWLNWWGEDRPANSHRIHSRVIGLKPPGSCWNQWFWLIHTMKLKSYYVCIFSSWGIIKKFHFEGNKLWFRNEKKKTFLRKMQDLNFVSYTCKSEQVLKAFHDSERGHWPNLLRRQDETKTITFLWFFPLLLLALPFAWCNTIFQNTVGNRR